MFKLRWVLYKTEVSDKKIYLIYKMKSQKGSSLQEVKLFSQYDEYFFKTDLREAKHTFVKKYLSGG